LHSDKTNQQSLSTYTGKNIYNKSCIHLNALEVLTNKWKDNPKMIFTWCRLEKKKTSLLPINEQKELH
jgi:hypothetical protein